MHGVGGDKLNFQYRTNFTVQLCEGDIFCETYCYVRRKNLRFLWDSREYIKREARKEASLKLCKVIRSCILQWKLNEIEWKHQWNISSRSGFFLKSVCGCKKFDEIEGEYVRKEFIVSSLNKKIKEYISKY